MVKGFAKFIFAVTLIIASISLIIEMKYDLSLNKYLAYSAPLTQEEQEYLKERETLVFGADFDRNPYLFYNGETEEPDGLLKDYIGYIERDTGIDIEIRDVESGETEKKLKNGKIDITDILKDKDSERTMNLTQSVYGIEGIMVTNYKSDIREYRDLNQKTLALVKGENSREIIESVMPKGDSIKIKYADNVREGLELLRKGQADAFAGNKLTIDKVSRDMNIKNSLRHVGDLLYEADAVLAVNIYDPKLCNIMNKEILRLKKTRLYGEQQEAWLGATALMGTGSTSVRWAQWIITLCVSVVILLMLWESVLNNRIDQKTRQIKTEKKNLQTVIDNISALVAVINKNGDLVTCNQYGKEMLDDERGSFIGCNIKSIEMLSDLYKLYEHTPDKPFYYYNDRYYQISLNDIGHKDKNYLLMITDCTEQTIAEQKMRQESKMIAVGQLSAGLTHEIRNPLGLIKTYSYLLKDYATDEMSEHSLEVISDSVGRIDNLIDNLLNFSRLSNDKPETFNVTRTTKNIIELGKKTFEREHVEIIFSPEKELTVTLIEEPIKIVVYNLINNAIEAFNEAGQDDGKIVITESLKDDILKINVKDNGPGMTEETVENIFNPFFTTKDAGTGLGLYIVITELKKINGQIRVKSTIEKGTEFIIEIPVLH